MTRTTCACRECVDCCKTQPGYLIPGDLERIADYLGVTVEALRADLWASPGAVVMDSTTGRTFRIGTITPKYLRREKRCVFLDAQDRCRIHAVAPFGCAYFDTHMGAAEGNRRSVWGLKLIQADANYQDTRAALPLATHYKGWKR